MQSNYCDVPKLPVFVFPSSLDFVEDDRESHKQCLKVYNPYEFAIRYQILCNRPDRYNVINAEGIIRAKCFIDAIVRYKGDFSVASVQSRDKFRIQYFYESGDKILGLKDLCAYIKVRHKKHDDFDQSFEPATSDPKSSQIGGSVPARMYGEPSRAPSLLLVFAALMCIVALLLPLIGESSQFSMPEFLYLSVHQKLAAAYILGLVTMPILRL